jgi:hypothetical protein
MVQEWTPETKPFSQGEVDYAEHSAFAKAKKVIDGPLNIPQHESVAGRQAAAIHKAMAGAITVGSADGLKQGKAYRMISNIAFHFVQAAEEFAGPATVSDTYVPANTPVVIQMIQYDRVYAIPNSGSGFLQLVEVR